MRMGEGNRGDVEWEETEDSWDTGEIVNSLEKGSSRSIGEWVAGLLYGGGEGHRRLEMTGFLCGTGEMVTILLCGGEGSRRSAEWISVWERGVGEMVTGFLCGGEGPRRDDEWICVGDMMTGFMCKARRQERCRMDCCVWGGRGEQERC